MNLETKIDSRLWQAIKSSYESSNFSNAILDGVHFLGELIRERTGLESDGVTLIGQAFGGKAPKLRVNKLITESDLNIQKGIEQLLRGIYQAIRNPRSHEKYNDSIDDANAIILFMSFLLKTIDQAKSPFTKNDFLKRVFDSDFVPTDAYANLLATEIPKRYMFDVLIDVMRDKEKCDIVNLSFFIKAMFESLTEDEKSQLYDILSEELKYTNSETTIRYIIKSFAPLCWNLIDEAPRLRIENKLIKSVKDGRHDIESDTCRDGALGTWITNIPLSSMTLKEQYRRALLSGLGANDRSASNYILHYHSNNFFTLNNPPDAWTQRIINKLLKEGYELLHDVMWYTMEYVESWQTAFKDAFEIFKPAPKQPDDDIPF